MGHGHCHPKPINPIDIWKKKRKLLKFFQVASDEEIINRYPCLGETLAHTIILRRRKAPLKHLREVWNLETIRKVLLADYSPVVKGATVPEPVINERPTPSLSISTRMQTMASHAAFPSASPYLPQLPSMDYSVMELIMVLDEMGLVESWKRYINDSDILITSDVLPSNTYRLATWNLDRLTVAKAKHSGIREAICLTILSNQFTLIAFQEIIEPKAVQLLVNELNAPVLPMVKRWIAVNQTKSGFYVAFSSSDKTGRTFQAVEYSSFLYRSDRLQALSSRVLAATVAKAKPFSRMPFMSKFKLGSRTLVLTSVHLKAPGLRDSDLGKNTEEITCLADFVDALDATFSSDVYYIIMGDFNMDPGNKAFDVLRSRGLTNALPSACTTMASAVDRFLVADSRQGESRAPCLDNAWFCPNLLSVKQTEVPRLRFTGFAAVACLPLHPLIFSLDCSNKTGRPSDHCPVYFDLTLDESAQ